MSIRDDARQEAERRWPVEEKTTMTWAGRRVGFELGAIWRDEQADREPSDAYVTILAREFERIWNGRVETFDPEVHDETPFIEGIMRDALLAAQEVRRG